MTPCEAFSRIVTSDYTVENKTCSDFIRKSWANLNSVASTQGGLDWISKEFKLCNASKDIEKFKDWLADVYTNLAMVNYPYPTNFLANLPAYPIKEICSYYQNDTLVGKDQLKQLFLGLTAVYFNYTGKVKCIPADDATTQLGESGWDFQVCTKNWDRI